MSLINSTAIPNGASYEIDQSLKFEDGNAPYLERTPVSAGNRKTWTVSVWLKRGNIGQVLRGREKDALEFGVYGPVHISQLKFVLKICNRPQAA